MSEQENLNITENSQDLNTTADSVTSNDLSAPTEQVASELNEPLQQEIFSENPTEDVQTEQMNNSIESNPLPEVVSNDEKSIQTLINDTQNIYSNLVEEEAIKREEIIVVDNEKEKTETKVVIPKSKFPEIPIEEMKSLWAEVVTKKNSNQIIELTTVNQNRGGVVASYKGLEVFIPSSHWTLDRNPHITKEGDVFTANFLEVTSFDTDARRITASRRSILRREKLETLNVGDKLKGKVSSVLDFGAFIDLGGIEGLLHISEMSHTRGSSANELVKKGEEIEVIIKDIDKTKKKISLTRKELLPSPWVGISDKYKVGEIIKGKVSGISKVGAYVAVVNGIEGFVRISELSWTKRINDPSEVLKKGDEVNVKVLGIDEQKQKMSLSYKQTQENPWQIVLDKFTPEAEFEGVVKSISSKGVVLSVDEIEGFLPRGRMGKLSQRLTEIHPGEVISICVIEVDSARKSVIFGIKGVEREPRREAIGERRDGGSNNNLSSGGGGMKREGGAKRDGDRRNSGSNSGDKRDGNNFGGGGGGKRFDRREQTGPPTKGSNELKTSETVSNFTIGEMLGDALKKLQGN